jgi:hypothetical protein
VEPLQVRRPEGAMMRAVVFIAALAAFDVWLIRRVGRTARLRQKREARIRSMSGTVAPRSPPR